MRFYIETAKNVFKQNTAYRFAYWIELIGILLGFVVQYYIWRALLETSSSTTYGAISFQDMIRYAVLSSVISVLTNSSTIGDLGRKILTGDIAMDLIRPVNLRGLLFSRAMGETLFKSVFLLLPVWMLGSLLFGVGFQSGVRGGLFVLACLQGTLLYFFLSYCLGLLGFWFTQIYALDHFLMDAIRLFSGSLIPIWFFPGWLQTLSRFLPFQSIYFVPISIFMNKVSLPESGWLLLEQLGWILLFKWVGDGIWKKAVKKLVVQGG